MKAPTLPPLWPQVAPAQSLLELSKAGELIEVPSLNARTYQDPTGAEVSVQEFAVDFEDPGACTEIRLRQLLNANKPGVHYLNPQFTVSASDLCGTFCEQTEKSSRGWFRNLDRVVRTRGRKAMYKQANRKEKSLGYAGVIVIHGKGPSDAGPLLRKFAKIRQREQRKTGRKSHYRTPNATGCEGSVSP